MFSLEIVEVRVRVRVRWLPMRFDNPNPHAVLQHVKMSSNSNCLFIVDDDVVVVKLW